MLKKISIAIFSAVLMTCGMASARAENFNFEVFASNLDSPRGISFGPDGALYVTEAGRGGTEKCIPSPVAPNGLACYGLSGAITRISNGNQERIVTGLPSLASTDGTLAFGPSDIAFDSSGRPYALIGYAGDPEQRAVLGNFDFGQLVAINNLEAGASWTRVADIAAYEGANNPDNEDVASNPYAFLIKDDKAFVVDAAANDLLSVGLDGSELALQSLFPSRLIKDASGTDISLQSVPTSIAIGSDNAFYVGEFTAFPYPSNAARVYRINSNNQPEVYLDGFTNIIDLAIDSRSNLYVLEYAANSLASANPIGALTRVDKDGNRTTITSELQFPTALTLGSDGAIYIANRGFQPESGQIIKIRPNDNSTSVPEPTLTLSVLAFGAYASFHRTRRKKSFE